MIQAATEHGPFDLKTLLYENFECMQRAGKNETNLSSILTFVLFLNEVAVLICILCLKQDQCL